MDKSENVLEMWADLPSTIPRRGKVLTGPSPGERKIGAFQRTFIIVMSQNGQGVSFAGRCG